MKIIKIIVLVSMVLLTSFSFADFQPNSSSSSDQVLLNADLGIAPRIISGQPASDNYDFFVTLMFKYEWATGEYHWNPFCGGSYIGNGVVVTAAHCVDDISDGTVLSMVIGDVSTSMEYEYCSNNTGADYDCITRTTKDLCESGYHYTGWAAYKGAESNIYSVTKSDSTVPVHTDYGVGTGLGSDIALIKLGSVPSNTPIELPAVDEFSTLAATGNAGSVRVIGFGDTISDTNSDTFEASSDLLEVDLTPRTDAVCFSSYGSSFQASTMVCAGDAGLDSCQGDSGGPLFNPLTNTLIGVVSWGGLQCGSSAAGAYGVYSDVYNLLSFVNANKAAVSTEFEFRDVNRHPALRNSIFRSPITDGCSSNGASASAATSTSISSAGETLRLGREAGSLGFGFLFVSSLLLFGRSGRSE